MPSPKNSKKTLLMTGAAMTSAIVIPFASSAQIPAEVRGQKRPLTHASLRMDKAASKNTVSGTVESINGNTITMKSGEGTSYTVDASKAKIAEGRFISGLTLDMIEPGDALLVNGGITGTAISARTIMDTSLVGRRVFTGTVASIDGMKIGITQKGGILATVDAAGAAVTKGFLSARSSGVGEIGVGDRLVIVGNASGTSIAAKTIRDLGSMQAKTAHYMRTPFISGTVRKIDGSSISIDGSDGKTYAVDASGAKISAGLFSSGISLSDMMAGDAVMISGTIEGTNVTAKTISDASLIGRIVFTGTVASISGNTITLNAKRMTTLTVDASKAAITSGMKGAEIGAADIKKGDRLTVIGALANGIIAAKTINDIGQIEHRSY